MKRVIVRCEASDCFHFIAPGQLFSLYCTWSIVFTLLHLVNCFHFIAPGQLFSSFQHDSSWLLLQSLSLTSIHLIGHALINANLSNCELQRMLRMKACAQNLDGLLSPF